MLTTTVGLYLGESKARGRRKRTGLRQKARARRTSSVGPQTRSQTRTENRQANLSLDTPLLQQSPHLHTAGNIGVRISADATIWPAGKVTCKSTCQRKCGTDIARRSAHATIIWGGTEREPKPHKSSLRSRRNDDSWRCGGDYLVGFVFGDLAPLVVFIQLSQGTSSCFLISTAFSFLTTCSHEYARM